MTNIKNIFLATATTLALVSSPAMAQEGEVKLWPTPEYKAADGSFKIKARGRLLQDFGWVSDTDGTYDITDDETRTGRLGFEVSSGKAKLKVELDFAGGGADFKDLTFSYKGPVNVTVGNHKIAPSLEEAGSSRYIDFMERGSFTDAFSLGRNLGVSLSKAGDNWSVVAGVGKGSINAKLENTPITMATRFTYSPDVENMTLHLGTSLRHRKTTGTGSDLRYRQRPHNHISDRFINTGRIADRDTLFGVEFALISGALSVQAEYSFLNAKLSTPIAGEDTKTFSGGYISTSYFLTGESRNYDRKKGSFGRTKINKSVNEGGIGAWQVAARYDYVDLTDTGVAGGTQKTYILGLNWHLTRHVRMMFNYNRSNITGATLVAANGADGENGINAYGVRMQVNW